MSAGVWEPVPGYEGLYEACDDGRVRSLDKIDALGRPREGRVLKPRDVGCGYQQVTLCDGKTKKQLLVHRVVCATFHGAPPSSKHQVDHINGNKKDNRAANLEWVTASENNTRSNAPRIAKRLKPVVRVDPDGTRTLYPGIKQAVADGYSTSAVYRCVHGIRPSVNGIKWEFASRGGQ